MEIKAGQVWCGCTEFDPDETVEQIVTDWRYAVNDTAFAQGIGIGGGSKLDPKEFTGFDPWPSTDHYRKPSRLMRAKWWLGNKLIAWGEKLGGQSDNGWD